MKEKHTILKTAMRNGKFVEKIYGQGECVFVDVKFPVEFYGQIEDAEEYAGVHLVDIVVMNKSDYDLLNPNLKKRPRLMTSYQEHFLESVTNNAEAQDANYNGIYSQFEVIKDCFTITRLQKEAIEIRTEAVEKSKRENQESIIINEIKSILQKYGITECKSSTHECL